MFFCIATLTFVSVAVSAMFRALLRTPKEAAGAKAAAEPTRTVVIASFIFVSIDREECGMCHYLLFFFASKIFYVVPCVLSGEECFGAKRF